MNIDWLHSVLALAFHSELEYHHLDDHINSGDNAATSYKIWWTCFSNPVDSVAYLCTSYDYRTKIDLPIFIRRAGIPKRVERLECRWGR